MSNIISLVEELQSIIDRYGIDAVQHTVNFIRTYPTIVYTSRFSDTYGSVYILNESQMRELRAVYANGANKISAIKLFREFTGCGLKEAKDAIETYSW